MIQGIFLDIESNGLDCYRHCVMQVAFQLIQLDTGKCIEQFSSDLFLTPQEWQASDPHSLCVNGLADYNVHAKAPTRAQVGSAITELFQKQGVHRDQSIFICQNPSFDRPFFAQLINTYEQERHGWPYHWLDLASMFWAQHVAKQGNLPSLKTLSKDSIAKALHLAPEAKPHQAMAGVEHLVSCYGALVGWPTLRVQQAIQASAAALQVTSTQRH